MIDAMYQEGTDAALNDQVKRPAPPKPVEPRAFGADVLTAPFRGIGGGAAKSMAFGAELVGAFGQVYSAGGTDSAGGMFSTQSPAERKTSEAARNKLLTTGPDPSNAVGDAFRARAKDILPDPNTASTGAQVVSGLADFATRAVGYSVTLGPAGPLAMGGDAALEESDRLKQQGVNVETRTKAGAVAGVLNAAGVAIPMHGATALTRFGIGVGVGEGTIVGQSVAEKAILKAAGYDKIAETFDPLDPVALALGVVPGALGAKFGKPRPAAPARQPHPGASPELAAMQAATDAARLSPDRIGVLQAEMVKPETSARERAKLQAEIENIRTTAGEQGVARAVAAEPDLVPAARVGQVAEALDRSRLTPADDLVGRDAHVSAVELAADQIGRGERVQVADRIALEQANLGRAFDQVLADPKGPKFDPLVMIRPEDIDAVAIARGGYKGLGDVDVKGQGFGLVKFIWRHGPESNKAPEFAIGRDDVLAVPEVVRGYESQIHRDQAGNEYREWIVERPGPDSQPRKVVYVDKVMGENGRHMVSLFVQEPGKPGAERPLSKQRPDLAADSPGKRSNAESGDTPPAVLRLSGQQGSGARSVAPKGAGSEPVVPAAAAQAAAEVAKISPDMLVQLEGMDAPMKVGDLMARVKEEAAQDVRDGRLVEVAAECALRN